MNVEFAQGPFLNAHSQIVSGSGLEASEIMTLRESRPEFGNSWAWTNNFSMYRVEQDEAFLYFTGREHNLGFRDIQDFTSQLREAGNYVPSQEGIQEVVGAASSGKALKIKISDLQLQKHNRNDEYGFFDVDPDNLDLLNSAQKQFVQVIYGNSRPGNRVYVLDSQYVKKTLKDKEDSAIARASWLGGADYGSWFVAGGRDVGIANVGLLGVLKEAPQAPQKIEVDPYSQAYDALLANPQEALRRLTPERATGLSTLLTSYLANLPKA